VIIVDPRPISRSGLHALLDQQAEIIVAGSSPDEQGAHHLLNTCQQPVVVVVNHQLPHLDSKQVVLRLAGRDEPPAVLVLGSDPADPDPVRIIEAGARGYVTRDAQVPLLLTAICCVAAGGIVLDPAVAPALLQAVAPLDGVGSELLRRLSPQEQQVLGMLAGGLSNAEIAGRLMVAHSTVKKHVSAVLRKLDLRDRQQALVFAYENGISSLADSARHAPSPRTVAFAGRPIPSRVSSRQ
jgi:DNA-binding NarL/FixJ family response regulator